MKYTIIFCILLVLINSKKEIKPKFSLLKGLKDDDFSSDSSCEADTKDKCKNLPIPEEDEQCCYVEYKIDGTSAQKICNDFPNDFVEIGDIYEMKEYRAAAREELGYGSVSDGDEIPYKKVEQKITCKDNAFTLALDTNFSDKEKKIFEDKKHCLHIQEEKESDFEFDVGECKNYILTDHAKSNGIECGYYTFKITLDTKETVTSTTCNIFNLKLIQKIANKNPNGPFDEEDAREIVEKMGKSGNIESFIAEAYNGKGKKITYDSKTKKIVVEGSGFMLTASKYLFLLFLILF